MLKAKDYAKKQREIVSKKKGNVTVLTELTGQQVWDGLENGFSKFEDGAGRFPQVSGLKLVVDVKQPASQRIVSVEANGKPLDPAPQKR